MPRFEMQRRARLRPEARHEVKEGDVLPPHLHQRRLLYRHQGSSAAGIDSTDGHWASLFLLLAALPRTGLNFARNRFSPFAERSKSRCWVAHLDPFIIP